MYRLLPALGLLVAGCASTAVAPLGADHPASPDAPAAPVAVSFTPLAPAPAPDVPPVLRPDARPPTDGHSDPRPLPHGMDHSAMMGAPGTATETGGMPMSHAAAHHRPAGTEPTPTDPAGDVSAAPAASVGSALDAYLAVHDALASDRLDAEAAAAFEKALVGLVATPPAGDPHLWHRLEGEVETARHAARVLAEADGVGAGRSAFGVLSVPFAALVEAAGVPEGYPLVRHTCGMTDAPEGGVWLQREGPVRNPYFGTGMLLCSRGGEAVGGRDAHEGHEGGR